MFTDVVFYCYVCDLGCFICVAGYVVWFYSLDSLILHLVLCLMFAGVWLVGIAVIMVFIFFVLVLGLYVDCCAVGLVCF